MNKSNMSKVAMALCLATLLGGCSWMNNEDEKVKESAKDVEEKAKEAGDTVTAKIDDMMGYLKDKGMEMSDVKTLDKMDFAAHEGRSFMYNGSQAYLYNLNMEDAGMKSLVQDVGKHQTVKVKQNGEEKEYGAVVNGSYLLVYDKEADYQDMVKTFPDYKMTK